MGETEANTDRLESEVIIKFSNHRIAFNFITFCELINCRLLEIKDRSVHYTLTFPFKIKQEVHRNI